MHRIILQRDDDSQVQVISGNLYDVFIELLKPEWRELLEKRDKYQIQVDRKGTSVVMRLTLGG